MKTIHTQTLIAAALFAASLALPALAQETPTDAHFNRTWVLPDLEKMK